MPDRRRVLAVAGTGAVAAGAAGYWAMTGRPSYDDAVRSTWDDVPASGDGEMAYLVHHARLAANSHNTQPWLFGGTAQGMSIRPDFRRATPVVDPDSHHLFASLGCAAENLSLAAGAAGKAAAIAFENGGDGHIAIDLAGSGTRDPLFDAIAERQCTRSDYDGKPVSTENLKLLAEAAKLDGSELLIITDRAKMEQVLEQVIAANTMQVEDPAFTAELKSWLRFSAARAVASGDGLYAACSSNPTMPQWLGNTVFGFVFKPEAENDRYARQIRSSSGLAVFASEKNDKQHWVQAGRSYQRFALQATTLGIRIAFVNQPVEVDSVRPEFAKLLGIGTRRPDLVVRFGHAPAMPKSLRRPVKDVIVQAGS